MFKIERRHTFLLEQIERMISSRLRQCEPRSVRYIEIQQNATLSEEQRFSQLYALDAMWIRYALCHDVFVTIAQNYTQWRRQWTLLRPRTWRSIDDIPHEVFQSAIDETNDIVKFYRKLATPDAKVSFDKYEAFLFFLREYHAEQTNKRILENDQEKTENPLKNK